MPRLGWPHYPNAATLWLDEFQSIDERVLGPAAISGQRYSFVFPLQSITPTHGARRQFTLAGGVYRLNVLGNTSFDEVIIAWYIDDALVLSDQDWYSDVTVRNVLQSGTVVVPAGGTHWLTFVVTGQNVLSNDTWRLSLTKVWFDQAY